MANKGDFAEFVAEYIVEQSDADMQHEDLELMESIAEKVRPILERTMSYSESMSRVSDTSGSRRISLLRSSSRVSRSSGKSV